MALNQLNFGHAVTVTVISPLSGNVLTLTNVTEFDSKQNSEKIKSAPLNAKVIFAHIPNGWTGTVTFDRQDNSIDEFFAAMEAAYWSNSKTFDGAIFESITELDGTISQYKYEGVTFTFEDAGKKTSQTKITLKLAFEASDRVVIQ